MTDTEARVSTRAAAGERRLARTPARLQPLLLAAGVAAVLPAVGQSDRAGAGAVIVVLTFLAVGSVMLWTVLRRTHLSTTQRHRTGRWMAVASVAGLLLVLVADGQERPEVYLLVTAALVCSLASIRARTARWTLQLVSVAAVGVAVAGASGLLEAAVSMGLLLSVALLANVLASELMRARRMEVAARADAERRTELLEAVRDLPGSTADEAVEATLRTLRSLAFDDARVAVLRNGQLYELGRGDGGSARLDGADQAEPRVGEAAGRRHVGAGLFGRRVVVPRGDDLAWQAIDDDRTITSPDRRIGGSPSTVHNDIRSVVVAPIRIAGLPAGAVVGGRSEPGEPSAAEVEVAEVLAAHLGVVLDMESQVRRQRHLLERMAELDHMRSGFAREVSSELRDPLTIVRTVGDALARHGDALETDRRRMLLQQMCDQADELRQTIDAMMDFSRFQASRDEAELVNLPLVDLLAPVLRATGANSEPPLADLRALDVVVDADVELVRHALEIVLVAGIVEPGQEPAAATLVLDDRPGVDIRLRVVRRDGTVPSTLVRSLVSQLLVAGGAALADGSDPVVVLRNVSAVPVERV